MRTPLILDFDGSAGAVPGAVRLALGDWQEAVRFGCGWRTLRGLRELFAARLPATHGTALLGSGDFHHVSLLLIERCAARAPLEVVVFDNHPDNMRFPFGVHCGSWVRAATRLPHVAHVHVVGITSADVGPAQSWQNRLLPLYAGRLTYWCIGADTRWARCLGLGRAVRRFGDAASLLQALAGALRGGPLYVSIDKDVLDPAVVRTNWDQGVLREAELLDALRAFGGRIVGSDITGEVSAYRYRTPWKRWLSALDAQPAVDPAELAAWQARQQALNARLLAALG
ncbi:hypothetical protein MBSD_n0501 [Mizugakiibacter sediminis]|uniref:Arginase family protein n=1 Tax=Mizugakiibacter sediminis TaxID=1475481 RepID=A0A0K8QLB4_9GAMM|nr:arginase family protein [Mizugakiibacter sediminis]GAP65212.1 hypothetical protein MBSD_n0501 [Mizugakiibacter sediminis]